MKYRHYSPNAKMFLFDRNLKRSLRKSTALLQNHAKGLRTGVLSSLENKDRYMAEVVVNIGVMSCLEDVASRLYNALRKFDEEKVDIIYSSPFQKKDGKSNHESPEEGVLRHDQELEVRSWRLEFVSICHHCEGILILLKEIKHEKDYFSLHRQYMQKPYGRSFA